MYTGDEMFPFKAREQNQEIKLWGLFNYFPNLFWGIYQPYVSFSFGQIVK